MIDVVQTLVLGFITYTLYRLVLVLGHSDEEIEIPIRNKTVEEVIEHMSEDVPDVTIGGYIYTPPETELEATFEKTRELRKKNGQ